MHENIHMIGIGGIGMSALAQLYHARGAHVTGCSNSSSPTTDLLLRLGIPIAFTHDDAHLCGFEGKVIYSDAIPKDHPERAYAEAHNIDIESYFEALGDVSKDMLTIAIAGTHGKTTTTAMLAKILADAGCAPTAIIGSLARDFGSNYVAGRSDLLVVEACEYRNHLLELSPRILVINNLEWDHTDFFPNLEALKETFHTAIKRMPPDGVIITDVHNKNIAPLLHNAPCRVIDYRAEDSTGLSVIGDFNVQNAQAAKAAAKAYSVEISDSAAIASLNTFKGTWRRLEHRGTSPRGGIVYDDYAHHPTAVRGTIDAIKEKYPGHKIIVAFHPHLFSRTRDFMDEFAEALSHADTIVLAPIYPAREDPIVGITSDVLAEKILAYDKSATAYTSLDAVEECLRTLDADDVLIVTMGAGDIYHIADALIN